MQSTSGVDAAILSLPKGGGAVQPIGTTFDVDLNTGSGSFSIPLELPAGPNGIRPELTLRYSSGAGEGIFGIGWTLGLLTLVRRTDVALPDYGPDDQFALSGNENLIETEPGRYRPVVDTLHWLIERRAPGWRLTDTHDQVYRLGMTANGRVSSSDGGTERVGTWLLETMTDAFGNEVGFGWQADGAQRMLAHVEWGSYTLSFVYEPRPDRVLDGRFGFLVETRQRCRQIILQVNGIDDPLVRSWDFAYDDGQGTERSRLASVTMVGHGRGGVTLAAPATRFGYTAAGAPALTRFAGSAQPPALGSGDVELVDWDGDGLPDVLETGKSGARLWRNLGACRWAPPSSLTDLPAPYRYRPGAVAFADMDGGGTADLVVTAGRFSGYYPLQPGGGFGTPRQWRDAPPTALAAPGTRLVDLDGTGQTSLLAPLDRGMMRFQRRDDGEWRREPELLARPGTPPLDLRDPHVALADMTGDGLLDLVRVDGSGVIYYPSIGRGSWASGVRMTPSPVLPKGFDPQRLYVVDVDGDGCADLLYVDQGRVLVWFNTGADRLTGPRIIAGTPSVQPAHVRLADMTGRGALGIVFTVGAPGPGNRRPWLFLDLNGGTKPHLLATIHNGLGLTTVIDYAPSTSYAVQDRAAGQPWNTFHPFPVQCVDKITCSDAITGVAATTRYRYQRGRYDPLSRAFLGFGQVTSDVVGDAIAPTTRTVTTFHLGLDPADPNRPLGAEERLRLGALRRRVLTTSIYGLDGSPKQTQPYSIVRHQYDTLVQRALGGRSVIVPFERQTIEETWERGDAPYATRQIDYDEVDERGNVGRQRNRVMLAGQAAPVQDVTTVTAFAKGGINQLGVPARVTQTDGDGSVLAATVTCYDGDAFQGLPEGQIARGAVTRIEELVVPDVTATAIYGASQPDWAGLGYHRLAGDGGWWATRCSYQRGEGPGSTTLVARGPAGGTNTSVTDPTGQFIRRLTDAVGNTLTAIEDARTSQTAQVTDPNGQVTADVFDALGRVTATIGPGDTAALPSVSYDYRTTRLPVRLGTSSRIVSGAPDVRTDYQFRDGFGRALASLSPGEGDAGRQWIMSGAKTYSAKGHIATVALARYVESAEWAPAPAATTVAVEQRYDALGRMIYQRVPGLSVTTWDFAAGRTTISRGQDGAAVAAVERHELDAMGRLAAVARFDGTRWVEALYAYDHANRLVAVHSPDGAATTMVYDLRGGLLQQTGVDTGTTRTVIDAARNMAERRLPTGQTLRVTVDALNRVTKVVDAGNATPAISYAYLDSGAPTPSDGMRNRVGRLYSVTDGLGTLTFRYDSAGRPIGSTRKLVEGPPGSFETDTAYDQLGRTVSVTLPAVTAGAERTTVTYGYGPRGLLTSAAGLVRSAEYDVHGRLTRMIYDNGAANLAEFDPLTGRMTRQKVLDGNGAVLRDQSFAFDGSGNLAAVTSPDAADAVQYSYDGLNRLLAAHYGNGDTFGYAYSDGGNITKVDGLGPLTYGAAPGSAAVASAGGAAYAYDAAGRMSSAPYGTLQFDANDNLVSVSLAAGAGRIDYTYDFRGQRVATRRNGVLVALSATQHLEIQAGVAVLWLPFGAARVAAVSGGKRVFLHPDLSGTPTLFTGDDGLLRRRLAFGPFGTMRSDSAGGTAGGTGVADTGLICLGRRWYDPRIGRFISPDPVVPGVFTLQAWNPYIYCNNNPIAFMDPTGCSFWDVLAIIGVALVVVVLAAAAIFTGGATLAVAGLVINVSAGMMAATAVGIAGGAVIGGISAARAGGSIAGGVLLGGLLGGVGAFTGGVAGAAAGGLFAQGSFLAYVATGVVQGTIAGASTGVAVGFAGGKGSAEQILLAMAKGAAWGALSGALLGAATHFLFGANPVSAGNPTGANDNYVGLSASKWDPSVPAAAGLASKATVNYVDQYAGAGFDYASEVGDISRNGLSGFNGNGITEWVSPGYIPGSGYFEATASGSFSSGFNLGGVLLGRGGMLIAIPIGWVPEAVMSAGAVTAAVNMSMVLDYSGKMSFADQLVFLGNAVPILDLALGAFEEFKYGWWENGKEDFSGVFSSAPHQGS